MGAFLCSCSTQEQLKRQMGNLSAGASGQAAVFLCTFLPDLIPNQRVVH